MNYWYLAAALVTGIYFLIALFAFVLAYQRWCRPKVEVSVIRLLEEGDSDSGIFEDAEDEPNGDGHHAFANPAFEQ
ncbi:vpu protein [Simian immunodeficiency virus]|uniref:Vpu protein n=1 Tax=Simian immunodeficiency virus TaxID=11723 RepID=A4UDG8_SIV|nr:vpu protein [Simian immunodeficiency virus]